MQPSANLHLAARNGDESSSPSGSEDFGKRASAYVKSQEDQTAIDQTRIKVRSYIHLLSISCADCWLSMILIINRNYSTSLKSFSSP